MAEEWQSRLRSVLGQHLGIPVEQVTPELKMGDHPRWDSFGHMKLLGALEEEFGVRFPSHALARVTNVALIEKELARLVDRPA